VESATVEMRGVGDRAKRIGSRPVIPRRRAPGFPWPSSGIRGEDPAHRPSADTRGRYVHITPDHSPWQGMRRDYFDLETENVDWLDGDGDPEKPRVTIDFGGPAARLRERLTGNGDVPLEAAETDAGFRLQGSLDDPDAEGVFSVTNRVTGDFVLELNESVEDVMRFIRAARRYGEAETDDDARYQIRVRIDGEEVVTYDKRTFLVYNDEGNLLRKHSLIPSGVEL